MAETTQPSVSDRVARGKAARVAAPRTSHAALDLAPDRDPVGLLEQQAATRVPELVPIRYGRMLVSPFTFYRGAAVVMANDLAPNARTGLTVQLCGDCHLANFGGFASPERDLVFDINDFDETLPGPFEWDVKRLATSFEICARDREFSDADRLTAVLTVVRAYREAMAQFATMGNLDVWYSRLDAAAMEQSLRQDSGKGEMKKFVRVTEKGQTRDSMKAFSELTEQIEGGPPRIASDPPLIVPIRDLPDVDPERVEESVRTSLRTYRRSLPGDRRALLEGYRYLDLAHKVVGVGSVGTRCWIVLLGGRDNRDPLFLQVKEAQESVLEPVLSKSSFTNHGQRVVEGQRLMQATGDIFLGWGRSQQPADGVGDFYVRQLWDWKTSFKLDEMPPKGLAAYARACGWTLARAHARSGDRIAIASYLGKGNTFDRAIARFAEAYADLNGRDYEALSGAARSGRITVEKSL